MRSKYNYMLRMLNSFPCRFPGFVLFVYGRGEQTLSERGAVSEAKDGRTFVPNLQNAISKTPTEDFVRRVACGFLACRDEPRLTAFESPPTRSRRMPLSPSSNCEFRCFRHVRNERHPSLPDVVRLCRKYIEDEDASYADAVKGRRRRHRLSRRSRIPRQFRFPLHRLAFHGVPGVHALRNNRTAGFDTIDLAMFCRRDKTSAAIGNDRGRRDRGRAVRVDPVSERPRKNSSGNMPRVGRPYPRMSTQGSTAEPRPIDGGAVQIGYRICETRNIVMRPIRLHEARNRLLGSCRFRLARSRRRGDWMSASSKSCHSLAEFVRFLIPL